MQPTFADLLANLPSESEDPQAAREDLRALIAELGPRPVPTGRIARLWSLSTLAAGMTAAYLGWWVKSGFRGQDERRNALSSVHLDAALQLFSRMGYLRGAVMKLGQMLAHWPDVVPCEFADLLGRLHSEAPPMHFGLLREHVRGELGADPTQLFEEFDTEAAAAASLGQVHRARLKGSGQPVAVKIQYPGIGRTIRDDFRNLALFSQGIRFTKDWESVQRQLEGIHAMLQRETDYEQEAAFLEQARATFGEDEDIVVPRVHRELSSRQVLTMDWIDGLHLEPFLRTQPSQAARDRAGELVLRATMRLWYGPRLVYADPHPGNFLFRADGRLGLIDFGCCHALDPEEWDFCAEMERASYGTRADLLPAIARALEVDSHEQLEPEHLRLIEELCEWLWIPVRMQGPFDFSDRAHFRRGTELLRELMDRRYFRARPVSIWLDRLFYGVRALLTQLEARVAYGDIMRAESDIVSSSPP